MGKISVLRILAHDLGTSDKVYGMAVMRADDGTWRFVTFYGPRTGARPLVISQPIYSSEWAARDELDRTGSEKKRKGYRVVRWQDAAYLKVQAVIRDLDQDYYNTELTGWPWLKDAHQQSKPSDTSSPAATAPTREKPARPKSTVEQPPPVQERRRREFKL